MNPNGNVTNGIAWSEADVETLKQLWYVEGWSMLQIGNRMGRSRNAIAGKINRLSAAEKVAKRGLTSESRKCISSRNSGPFRRARKKGSVTMPKVKSPSMAPLLVAIDAPIEIPAFICSEAGPVEYLKLREHHCRALLEVRGSDGLLLSCGKPKLHPEEGGGSYCPDHHRLFTNPWATRRHDGQISKIRT